MEAGVGSAWHWLPPRSIPIAREEQARSLNAERLKMKRLIWSIAICLSVAAVSAGELSEADKKWSGVVEKMITEGPATISTPSANRAELARELAAKHKRECKVEKLANGFKITVQGRKLANK